MTSGIFISYRYNAREMDGIDVFHKELSRNYLCQGVGKWIPSCSEGGEIWITLFLTLPIGQFLTECLKDVLKDTVVHAGKIFLLEPFKKALRGLRKRNIDKWGLKVLSCDFKFDDIEIHIGGIKQDELERIEEILSKIFSVKDRLSP